MSDEAGFDYERTDIESTDITWLAAGLAVFVIAAPLLMPFAFPQSMRHRTPSAPPALGADAPGLEVVPSQHLQRLQRSQAALLDSYGWTDHERGAVRIPVRRAIELLAQRGLPGWPSP